MKRKAHSFPSVESTRHRILWLLKTNGPCDSIALAERLHLSPMAVRQQLYTLHDDGFVGCRLQSRRIGRPVKLWELTASARRFFPDCHAELSVGLMQGMQESYGEKGLRRVLNARTARQERLLLEKMPPGEDLGERLQALAGQQTEDGFVAEMQKAEDEALLLIENHCPILDAALSRSQLCEAELKLFSTVLGKEVAIERVEHILNGSRRCVYRITRRSGRASPPDAAD